MTIQSQGIFDDSAGELDESARERRSARLFSADMIVDGVPKQSMVVNNISSRGCGARADLIPPIGTAVKISIHGAGWIKGSVAWSLQGRFGIQFDEVMDVSVAVREDKPDSDFVVKAMHKPPARAKRPRVWIKS